MPVELERPEDESGDSQSKSRQARIRDNQRRSRARRQEHLQDLEKRLQECHVTCREAELQRTAFKELQIENARLRQLLDLVGVNPALTNTFLQQDDNHPQGGPGSLRQLKPKMPIQPIQGRRPEVMKVVTTGSELLPSSATIPSLSSASSNTSTHSVSPANFEPILGYSVQHRALSSTSALPLVGLHESHSHSQSQFQGGNMFANEAYSDQSFCCMVFGNRANAPLHPADSNSTVLCSLAKEMIDQYNIDGEELELIKNRLAGGFAPPIAPGESCRVNNQLLFEVLNDISGRLS